MSIVRNFNLYLNAGNGSAPYINVNQYDQGEQWVFTLYKEDGTKYLPSTGAIVGIKADNRGIINTGTVDAEGRVVINETQQMTAAAGIAIFELLIDGDSHGTANFLVNVEQRPGDNADLSDSDLSLIQQAVDSAEVIVEVIGDSDPSEVIGEHVDAWLDNHPEATTTVQDGAITAPKINSTLWDKLLVSEEASGAVASFDDGADDVPVSSLKVALEPIQTGSGDPSPSNIRPISGHNSVTVERTGKNLFGGTLAQAGANNLLSDSLILPSGTYTLSFKYNGTPTWGVYVRKGNTVAGATIASAYNVTLITFTLEESTEICFTMYYANGITPSDVTDVQIELGSTATTYEPYTGNTYPYTLGQSVYGGTVDLATGVLTVTHKYVEYDGSNDEAWEKYNGGSAGAYAMRVSEADILQSLTATVCTANYLQSVTGGDTWGNYSAFVSGSNSPYVYTGINTITTLEAWKTYLASNPLQVVYLLATPTTVQLTPQEVKTLLGYNNISSSGTVDVIYHADTKLYVDKMTNVDNAIIAPTEADFVATRNYTVNDLVIVNDTLYKVTANIASGSAITPNSNVTATTLGALIKALS